MDVVVRAEAMEVFCEVMSGQMGMSTVIWYAPAFKSSALTAARPVLRIGNSSVSAVPAPFAYEGGTLAHAA